MSAFSTINASGNKGIGIQDNSRLPQDTSTAAAAAVKEQESADIFKPQQPPDMARLVARLNDIREECSVLSAKLYGPMYPSHGSQPYKGPPYLERERLRGQLDELYEEESSIQFQLREMLDATTAQSAEVGKEFSGTATEIIQ